MALVDTHCHLDFSDFDDDRDKVIAAAIAANVAAIMVPGTRRSHHAKCQALRQAYPNLLGLGAGLHPYFVTSHQPDDCDWLAQTIADDATLFVGEIGLDAVSGHFDKQRGLFEKQLEIAARYHRPVVLHHRKTLDDMIPMLKAVRADLPDVAGVVHAFSGSLQQAEQYIDLGFKLGVGGVISYQRAQKTRAAIAAVPLSSLVLETDAPDMPLSGWQGHRNEPAFCERTFEFLCELRCESRSELEQRLWATSVSCFATCCPTVFS